MISQFTNPLHLYRALLRETTYLFDPLARKHIHEYVVKSFQTKSAPLKHDTSKKPEADLHPYPSLADRHQLKRGRKFLAILQRANQGYTLQLNRVLKMTYSRIGPRRRKVMAEIMARPIAEHYETPVDPAESPTTQPIRHTPTSFGHGWTPPPDFTALLQSQLKVLPALELSRRLRPNPTIPAQNVKGQPMPESRVRNMQKKWYMNTAVTLLPYLEEEEWDFLKAQSERKDFAIPQRRVPATVPVFEGDNNTISDSAKHLLQGPAKTQNLGLRITLGRPHKLTSRFLRRLYTNLLLRNTPKVIHKDNEKQLNFHWDGGYENLLTTKRPRSSQHNILFA